MKRKFWVAVIILMIPAMTAYLGEALSGTSTPVYQAPGSAPFTVTGSLAITPAAQFTAVPQFTQVVGYPTVQLSQNANASGTPVAQFTPVPQFTQIVPAAQFTQVVGYPTVQLSQNANASGTPVAQFTPVPQFTQIVPAAQFTQIVPAAQFTAVPQFTQVFPYPTVQVAGTLAANALPAAVSNGGIVQPLMDLFGRLFSFPDGPRQITNAFGVTFGGASPVTFIAPIALTFNDIKPGLNIAATNTITAGTVTIFNTGITFVTNISNPAANTALNYVSGGWWLEPAVNTPWVIESSPVTGFISGYYVKNQ